MIAKLLVSTGIFLGAALGPAPLALADPVSQYGDGTDAPAPPPALFGGQTVSPQEATGMLQAAQSALSAMPPEQVAAMLQAAQSALSAIPPESSR
jgi:hypothetical protein